MLTNLLNLLFPKCCFGCHTILLQNEAVICSVCRQNLPYTLQHHTNSTQLHTKFYGRVRVQRATSLLYFNKGGIVQKIFHQLKYNNHPEISYYLGMIYAEQLKATNSLEGIDEIIVVPMHPKKQKKRGYNQVDGFAKAISEVFDIPINNNVLYKTKNTTSQTVKTRRERSDQKIKEFDIRQNSAQEGTHFLLLDDILTTGSTLEACSKKLLQIPNSKVTVLCLAETV